MMKIIVEATDVCAGIAEQTLTLFFEPERNVLPKQGKINLKALAQVIAFWVNPVRSKPPCRNRSGSSICSSCAGRE